MASRFPLHADVPGPEFPASAVERPTDASRRDFVRGMAAALALGSGALPGCTRAPTEKIVPYRVQPEDVIPGRATHYTTAMTLDGYATGLIVESHEGRPTKVEGNPNHPSSLGASDAFEQAAVIGLYSPERLREVRHRGALVSEDALWGALRGVMDRAGTGRGVHVVLPPTSSALLGDRLGRLRDRHPDVSVHFHSPIARTRAWAGAKLAFGAPLEVLADLRRADVVLCLDSDVLAMGPGFLARAREFADRRRLASPGDGMNRLYVVESSMSVTGGVADHRLALRDGDLPSFAARLLVTVARALGGAAPADLAARLRPLLSPDAIVDRFASVVAGDLRRHPGASLVLVGDRQPPAVHAAAHALNALLGNVGRTVTYAASSVLAAGSDEHASLPALGSALGSNDVDLLVVLETNLADASPGDLTLDALSRRSRESLYTGQFDDRTARASAFAMPSAHLLESWGDTRALDGTASIVQPLISPMYGGRTSSEVLSRLAGDARESDYELLRSAWKRRSGTNRDTDWERALSTGVIAGTRQALVAPRLSFEWVDDLAKLAPLGGPALEVGIRPDYRVLDGRFGPNPWLHELPCPVTKLTWGNAALLGPKTARRLGVEDGDVLRVAANTRSVELPALLVAGHAEEAVTVTLGWGSDDIPGQKSSGANVFPLTTDRAPWVTTGTAEPLRRSEPLARTQHHFTLEHAGPSIWAEATLESYRKDPNFVALRRRRQISLYADREPRAAHQWGMAIDLNACTGCSICVIACQAENNVPTVGRDGVLKRREMHWLRIDRYIGGPESAPTIMTQPMACQQCERAPCEYVCPTGATAHSADGINQMTYNRCVGTRFCSNNCPYKVRRFNWFNYHTGVGSPTELAYNPNVTVRDRGVMEKCTYCVQRIREAEIRSKTEKRPLRDGDLRTACQQACPTLAITFGDLLDSSSEVARKHADGRAFRVLNELGTEPRTRYLARIRNPNPELT